MDKKRAAYRQILIVFVALAVLTIAEYIVAVAVQSAVLLIIIALAKAGLILQYFMHVYRVWRSEAH